MFVGTISGFHFRGQIVSPNINEIGIFKSCFFNLEKDRHESYFNVLLIIGRICIVVTKILNHFSQKNAVHHSSSIQLLQKFRL